MNKENSDPKDLVAHTEKTEKAITKNTEKADAKKTEKADAKKTEKADTEKTKKELKPLGKRERPTRGEAIEKSMYGAVAKMAKLQEESDLRYLEVEGGLSLRSVCLKWKTEDRENRERDTEQKREDREFQLKVYTRIINNTIWNLTLFLNSCRFYN